MNAERGLRAVQKTEAELEEEKKAEAARILAAVHNAEAAGKADEGKKTGAESGIKEEHRMKERSEKFAQRYAKEDVQTQQEKNIQTPQRRKAKNSELPQKTDNEEVELYEEVAQEEHAHHEHSQEGHSHHEHSHHEHSHHGHSHHGHSHHSANRESEYEDEQGLIDVLMPHFSKKGRTIVDVLLAVIVLIAGVLILH